MVSNGKVFAAETIGTMVLMVGGPGTAVLAAGSGSLDGAATLAVALAFGLSLLVAAYTVGPISGCHINPAVTFGLFLARKVEAAKVPVYLAGQVVGCLGGGFFVWVLAKGRPGGFDAEPATFATNLWGEKYGFHDFGSVVVAEVLLTGLLVFVVLSTTNRKFAPGAIGLTVGLVLTLIHLISIPIDNTSVNPVRSLGMAVFAGGDALEQLWAFFVFPLIGSIAGVMAWLAVDDATLDDVVRGGGLSAAEADARAGDAAKAQLRESTVEGPGPADSHPE